MPSIKEIISEFIGGVLFSLVCCGIVLLIYGDSPINKGLFFLAGTLILSTGSITGIFLIYKFFYKHKNYNTLGIIWGFSLSLFLGGFISLILLDSPNSESILLFPLIFVSLAMTGFHYKLLKPIFLKEDLK